MDGWMYACTHICAHGWLDIETSKCNMKTQDPEEMRHRGRRPLRLVRPTLPRKVKIRGHNKLNFPCAVIQSSELCAPPVLQCRDRMGQQLNGCCCCPVCHPKPIWHKKLLLWWILFDKKGKSIFKECNYGRMSYIYLVANKDSLPIIFYLNSYLEKCIFFSIVCQNRLKFRQ